jgi:hypothetical protein
MGESALARNLPKQVENDGQTADETRIFVSPATSDREGAMNRLRMAPGAISTPTTTCSRCPEASGRWDRIAAKSYCPQCEEQLAAGEADPLVERTEPQCCAVCERRGTICFRTFPLNGETPVEIDLCPEHLRALLSRRLGPHGFNQLQRQLEQLGIDRVDVFLLHEAFYDTYGRALKPVQEVI